MEPDELLRDVCDVCERLGLTYFVTGSTATISYGEPRFTNDIDIVIDLPAAKIPDFCQGFPADEFYISQPMIEQAVRQKLQFNVIHPASGLKIDFIMLSDSPFDQSRRARRRELSVLADRSVWFASPEDVILKKMVYYHEGGSDKHLRDIAGVLRIQGNLLDRDYIQHWTEQFGVNDIWQAIVAKENEA